LASSVAASALIVFNQFKSRIGPKRFARSSVSYGLSSHLYLANHTATPTSIVSNQFKVIKAPLYLAISCAASALRDFKEFNLKVSPLNLANSVAASALILSRPHKLRSFPV
jgi:hypothetical protein